MMSRRPASLALVGLIACARFAAAADADAVKPAPSPHTIGAPKLIVSDAASAKSYFESMFGMKEVAHYSADGLYDEPIMGYDSGARLALFQPKTEAALKKSQFPVALVYTPEFDALVQRIEDAKHPINRLPASLSGEFRIAIARDPSGNAIEILARADQRELRPRRRRPKRRRVCAPDRRSRCPRRVSDRPAGSRDRLRDGDRRRQL